jgi:HEAT repeat protein
VVDERSEQPTQSFDDYLSELANTRQRLKVSGLAQLSAMGTDESARFTSTWPAVGVQRRRAIVRELLDLEEDNVEFDFDAVFLEGMKDEDAEVRLDSVRGLWEHEAPDVIGPLVRLVQEDPDAAVRAEAALALGRFVLLSETGRLRERHYRVVEQALRQVITNPHEIDEVRARALEAVGARDDAWVRQAISEAYESGVRRMKVAAVHAMGRSAETRWLPLLLRELGNEEAEVRYEAAAALGSLGDESAVPHLVRALTDADEEVRGASVASLGEIGGREAKQALLELTREGSEAVRDAALEALAQIDFEMDPLAFRQRI